MKVGYCQNKPKFGEKEYNFKNIENLCKNQHIDLLVLPELFATGYTFTSKQEALDLSETRSESTTNFLMNIANHIDGVVVAGFAELSSDKQNCYNSAIMVNKSKILGIYRKIHLFFKEKQWFSPGNHGFQVFSIPYVKSKINIGIMICFDWAFPEAMRTLALNGADIIAHPANLVMPYCQNAMVTRCFENHVFEITANRIGTESRGEDSFVFTGQSQITDPSGKILHRGSEYKDECISYEIDPIIARNKQLNSLNNLFNDRKPEFYL